VQCKLYKVQHTIVLPLRVRRTVHQRSVAMQPIATTQPTTQHCCSAQRSHAIARPIGYSAHSAAAIRYRWGRLASVLWAVGGVGYGCYRTADRRLWLRSQNTHTYAHSTRRTLPSRRDRAVSAPIALERQADRQTNKVANKHTNKPRDAWITLMLSPRIDDRISPDRFVSAKSTTGSACDTGTRGYSRAPLRTRRADA
jgi:hypothetical protein